MTPRQGMTVMMGMDGRQKRRATNRVGDNSVSWSIVALLGHQDTGRRQSQKDTSLQDVSSMLLLRPEKYQAQRPYAPLPTLPPSHLVKISVPCLNADKTRHLILEEWIVRVRMVKMPKDSSTNCGQLRWARIVDQAAILSTDELLGGTAFSFPH